MSGGCGDLNQDGKEGRSSTRVAAMHLTARHWPARPRTQHPSPPLQYLAKIRNPVAGLDSDLYNEYTASKGLFWTEEKGETMEMPAETMPAASAPAKKD